MWGTWPVGLCERKACVLLFASGEQVALRGGKTEGRIEVHDRPSQHVTDDLFTQTSQQYEMMATQHAEHGKNLTAILVAKISHENYE